MPVGAVQRDAASTPFFEGTAAGELRIRHCRACGHRSAPAAVHCARCRTTDLDWVTASGAGVLVTWTVVHTRSREAGGPPIRTPVGVIELAEGPWIEAQLVDVDLDNLTAGAAMRVGFERPEGGEALPVFRSA